MLVNGYFVDSVLSRNRYKKLVVRVAVHWYALKIVGECNLKVVHLVVGEGDFPVGEFAELDTIVGIEKILKCEYFTVNIQTYHAADRHAAIVADTEAHVLPFHPHVLWVFSVDVKVVGFKVVFVTKYGQLPLPNGLTRR